MRAMRMLYHLPLSPHCRKVRIVLKEKALDFALTVERDWERREEFLRLTPGAVVPVLVEPEGDVLSESGPICEYLDETYPDPPLMPKHPAQRARARWLEEYADSRLSDLIVWRLFFPTMVAPWVFNTQPDPQAIAAVTERELPDALDWMEGWAPQDGFLFDHLCTADLAYACFFRNAAMANWRVDPSRWPRTAAWLSRIEAVPEFAATAPMEAAVMRSRPHERRDALRAVGARISEHSYAGDVPLMSVMLGAVE
jgi:glutathione S-transferase